jgi:hypothetical protein
METMFLLSESQMRKPQLNDLLLRKERPEAMEIMSLDNLAAQTLKRQDLSPWAKAELLANNLQRFLQLKPQGFPEENPLAFVQERERDRQEEEARRDETHAKELEEDWKAEQEERSAALNTSRTSRILTARRTQNRDRLETHHRSRLTTPEELEHRSRPRRSRPVSPRQSERRKLLADFDTHSPLPVRKQQSPSPQKRTLKQKLSRPPAIGNMIPPSRTVKKLPESLEKAREDARMNDFQDLVKTGNYAQAFGERGKTKLVRSPRQTGNGWIVI